MKKYIFTLLLTAIICAPFSLSAQITIGSGEPPQGFSVLELISGDERGLRLPRMTTIQRDAMYDTPEFQAAKEGAAMGLMIFNLTEGCIEVWSGSCWITMCDSDEPIPFTTPHPVAVTICYNDTHTFELDAATGGLGAITYQWQSSPDGTTWTNITGATNAEFTTSALTVDTHFRRIATAAVAGGTINSNSALVTVQPEFVTPHPTNQTICHNTSVAINLGVATGGSGNAPTYRWYRGNAAGTGGWTFITGATGQNLTVAQMGNLTATTSFRRSATRSGTGACGGTIYSNAAIITVQPEFVTPHPANATICHNTSVAINLDVPTGGGTATITYQWQRGNATGTGGWTNITNATGQNLTAAQMGNLTATTSFRRISTRGACSVTSNAAIITVHPQFVTPHPEAVSICNGASWRFTLAAPTGGGTATITYQWQQSTNGTTWTNIAGATSQYLTTPFLTANTHFRRIATRGACTVTSNAALVTVLYGEFLGGLCWATRNVGTPGNWAAAPENVGRLYQWNRRQDWPAAGTVSGWNPTIAPGTIWASANDPCPAGFRVATDRDILRLAQYPRVNASRGGVAGVQFGIAPRTIFIPLNLTRAATTGAIGTSQPDRVQIWLADHNGAGPMLTLFHRDFISSPIQWTRSGAVAAPVRCVRARPGSPMWFNPGDEVFVRFD